MDMTLVLVLLAMAVAGGYVLGMISKRDTITKLLEEAFSKGAATGTQVTMQMAAQHPEEFQRVLSLMTQGEATPEPQPETETMGFAIPKARKD